MTDPTNATVVLRAADPADDGALDRLSRLDSAPAIERPALLATLDGRPVAAISLDDGRVVADPFEPTDAVVGLLRRRAAALAHVASPARRRLSIARLRHA